MTVTQIFTEAAALVTTFGLMPFILAGAIAGMGAYLFRKFSKAGR